MKHNYIRVSDLAQQVLLEQRIKRLFESTIGDAKSILQQTQVLSKELKADGDDVSDDEVQAAMLQALIKANGKLNQVDVSDVESIKTEIKEARGYVIKESGSALIQAIEQVSVVLGNAALMSEIAGAIEETTGIKINGVKLANNLNKFFGVLKKVTGAPAKAMEMFFEWVSKKLGAGEWGQKVAGYSGTLILIVGMFALSVVHFPVLGGSAMGLLFSVTALFGKGIEMIKLTKEIFHMIKEKLEENPKLAKGETGAEPATA